VAGIHQQPACTEGALPHRAPLAHGIRGSRTHQLRLQKPQHESAPNLRHRTEIAPGDGGGHLRTFQTGVQNELQAVRVRQVLQGHQLRALNWSL